MPNRLHKGVNYSASTNEAIDEMIIAHEYERSIFHKSKVYTYSCYARDIENGRVEFIQYYKNGESKSTKYFDNRSAFWNR